MSASGSGPRFGWAIGWSVVTWVSAVVGGTIAVIRGEWGAAVWALNASVLAACYLLALRQLAVGDGPSRDFTRGYVQGLADAGARLIGVVAAEFGPDHPVVDRMVRRLGGLGDDERPDSSE